MKRARNRILKPRKKGKKTNIPSVPIVALPYTQEIRKQRRKLEWTFVILILIASFYTYGYWKNYQTQQQLISVVIANGNLIGPKALETSDLRIKKIPKRYLPDVFFTEITDVANKVLIPDLVKGEILLPKHFQGKLDPESISARFEEQFAFTLDEEWLMARLPELRTNDRIDILVSNPKSNIDQTIPIAQNIRVIEIQQTKTKRTLVLQMTSEQAQPIVFSRGLRLPMQVLVRSSIQKEKTLPQ